MLSDRAEPDEDGHCHRSRRSAVGSACAERVGARPWSRSER